MRVRSAALLAATVVAGLLPAVPATAALGPRWATAPPVPVPATSTGSTLRGVAAVSGNDVWVVGGWWDTTKHPLAAHWDGTGWAVAATPDGAGTGSVYTLSAVDAAARNDVWAVGSVQSTATAPLALHYDGVRWVVVPTPLAQSDTGESVLNGVDMLSGVDGWAVGYTATGGAPAQPLILRWRSGQWARVAVPSPAASLSGTLTSVAARSADDVWAVGSQTRADGTQASLVLHWNGVTWQESPVPGGGGEVLDSVAALPSGDVWAVGRACGTVVGAELCRPLALRMSGGTWQLVPSAGGGTELTAVLALSPTDVWAIGYASPAPQAETDYAEHWDGRQFTADPGLVFNEPASALLAAAATPDTGTLWAVGWVDDIKRGRTHAVSRT